MLIRLRDADKDLRLTPADVSERVQSILSAADDTAADRMAEELRIDVLLAIAAGSDDPRALADLALLSLVESGD